MRLALIFVAVVIISAHAAAQIILRGFGLENLLHGRERHAGRQHDGGRITLISGKLGSKNVFSDDHNHGRNGYDWHHTQSGRYPDRRYSNLCVCPENSPGNQWNHQRSPSSQYPGEYYNDDYHKDMKGPYSNQFYDDWNDRQPLGPRPPPPPSHHHGPPPPPLHLHHHGPSRHHGPPPPPPPYNGGGPPPPPPYNRPGPEQQPDYNEPGPEQQPDYNEPGREPQPEYNSPGLEPQPNDNKPYPPLQSNYNRPEEPRPRQPAPSPSSNGVTVDETEIHEDDSKEKLSPGSTTESSTRVTFNQEFHIPRLSPTEPGLVTELEVSSSPVEPELSVDTNGGEKRATKSTEQSQTTTEFDWNNYFLPASVNNPGGAGGIDIRGDFE
ncbi:carboxypeptidase Y-like [Diprion similis]|uniref:carboxypeptidase Y-like n=1 Tax=Diprion similis TaxID=362088 RepID=UPI001EF84F5D|nr:carboxypeptidase Y-like [Diprion similis]